MATTSMPQDTAKETDGRRTTPLEIPDWARDDIEFAIQEMDEAPWRELTTQFMRPYCDQVRRTRDLFDTFETQARETLLVEIFDGASRLHEALRFLNMPVPCDYDLLDEKDAVAVRTGYILCYIMRIFELQYEYANSGVRLGEEEEESNESDATCMASAVSQDLFQGRLMLIFMHSELHIAREAYIRGSEKPSYRPLGNDIVAIINGFENPPEDDGSDFILGFLGPHGIRPIDAIIPESYTRNIEAQVAMEMLLRDYKHRTRWGFFKRISLVPRRSGQSST